MMKKSIELDIDVIENIVVEELKSYYNLCNTPDKVDCSDDVIDVDHSILNAIDRVLQDYMDIYQYRQWKMEVGSENPSNK